MALNTNLYLSSGSNVVNEAVEPAEKASLSPVEDGEEDGVNSASDMVENSWIWLLFKSDVSSYQYAHPYTQVVSC